MGIHLTKHNVRIGQETRQSEEAERVWLGGERNGKRPSESALVGAEGYKFENEKNLGEWS